ncbi:MAG: MBOAT family protein, partial [Bacteroidota bacterium]
FHYSSRNDLYRNVFLTIFSLVFYAWAEPMWIFLMIFTAFANYGAGIFIEKHTNNERFKITAAIIPALALLVLVCFSMKIPAP